MRRCSMILQRLIKLYILKHHNCRCLPADFLSCLGMKGSKEAHKGRAPCLPHNKGRPVDKVDLPPASRLSKFAARSTTP